jgi:hypothetical protein
MGWRARRSSSTTPSMPDARPWDVDELLAAAQAAEGGDLGPLNRIAGWATTPPDRVWVSPRAWIMPAPSWVVRHRGWLTIGGGVAAAVAVVVFGYLVR